MHLFHSFKVRGDPKISYVFYADDYLLVAHATLRVSISLPAILNIYSTSSDHSINVTKYHIIFSLGTNPTLRHQVMDLLRISKIKMNCQYLGASLSSKFLHVAEFQFVLTKISNKITT